MGPATGRKRKSGCGAPCQMPPPTANSSFSRITSSSPSGGNTRSRSGVIARRNSLISVQQSSSVRSRGHSAASGSQQLIGWHPFIISALCGGLIQSVTRLAHSFSPALFPEGPFNGFCAPVKPRRDGLPLKHCLAGRLRSEKVRRRRIPVRVSAIGRFETLAAAHWRRRIEANRGETRIQADNLSTDRRRREGDRCRHHGRSAPLR